MEAIDKMLDTAIEFGLEVEVIYYSLKYMKENPSLSIIEAIVMAYEDWVK